jgi:hypothetical protein
MAFLLPISLIQYFDNNGNPAAGALCHVYEVGTTSEKDTYTTSALSVANDNPLEADSSGRFGLAYIDDDTTYKLVITDSTGGTTFYTADNLSSPGDVSANSVLATYTTKSADYTLVAGDNGAFIDFDASGADRVCTANSNTLGNGFNVTIGRRSTTGLVTITPSGGQTIDGQSSIIIDTDYEAVNMVSMGSTGWRIRARTASEPAGEVVGINEQTDSYTLVISDKGKLVVMSKATANTLTVPPNSSVAFPIGTRIEVKQGDAGETTIAEGSGVTINSAGSFKDLRVQESGVVLTKMGTNVWWLAGDIEA